MIIKSNTSKAFVILENEEDYPEFVLISVDKLRKFSRTNCSYCHSIFYVRKKHKHQYCNEECRTLDHTFLTSCAYCGVEVRIYNGKKKNSRSGFYFCCREHKDLAQRIGGIKEIQPPHYGSTSSTDYRTTAYRNREYKCEICGINKWMNKEIVLDVHHIDGNRKNNDGNNLQVVCPNCHRQLEMNKWASA